MTSRSPNNESISTLVRSLLQSRKPPTVLLGYGSGKLFSKHGLKALWFNIDFFIHIIRDD
jgi:hypothetical protein